ncbi:calcium-binding and coiled-coil domain-containing protein 2-like isoform X1 [Bufo gargarizans]|uniref:calcium-binding and coiled-coil domain-containing protein 2-like isoform X1 n=1 Tax=Bufo gargarizans TaxID=30331 RepID=UPI001CF2A72E|nr:calcium-binding and coiled-coil domain-containing protein 2-like isoform X1 [Bufo gargarizans]
MDWEAEDPPTSSISRAECNLSQVIFINMQPFYNPKSDIQCTFCRGKNFASKSKDWIGIFKVGWKTTREFCSWISARTSVDDTVLFKASFLPKDDDYYQFCYVDYKGEARGTSIPFQFSYNIPEDDDIVVVTSEMEMRTDKEKVDLKKIVKNLTKDNTQLQEKVSSLQNETQAQAEMIQTLQDKLLSSTTKMRRVETENMAECSDKNKKMGALHMTIANLEGEVKRLKDECKAVSENKIKTMGALHIMIANLESKVKRLKDECKSKMEAERTVRELRTQLQSAEEKKHGLERQLAQQQSKMEAERTTVRQLKTHLQSAEEMMQDLEMQLAQQKDVCREQGEEVLRLRSALELIEEDLKDVHKHGSSTSSTSRQPSSPLKCPVCSETFLPNQRQIFEDHVMCHIEGGVAGP